jgi:hypothetical protein
VLVGRTCSLDETGFEAKLYLHENLDLDAATDRWSRMLDIPTRSSRSPTEPWQTRPDEPRST